MGLFSIPSTEFKSMAGQMAQPVKWYLDKENEFGCLESMLKPGMWCMSVILPLRQGGRESLRAFWLFSPISELQVYLVRDPVSKSKVESD